jgi:pimeloyl-ACP methyl ester carboxylesterase
MLGGQGFSTLRFDFSGSGESEGNEVFSIAQQVKDIDVWVRAFGDYPSITLVGGSFSAWPAAIAAAKLPNVTGLVVINGFYGKLPPKLRSLKFMYYGVKLISGWFRPWKWEMEYAYKEFKPEAIKIPVLVAYTPTDEIVDYHESVKFYQQLQTKKRLAVIENTNHEVTNRLISHHLLEQFVRWYQQCEMDGAV